MSQFYAVMPVEFNSARSACDCLAHRFGNAADQPDRMPVYDSDMTDAQWAVVRDAMPTPASRRQVPRPGRRRCAATPRVLQPTRRSAAGGAPPEDRRTDTTAPKGRHDDSTTSRAWREPTARPRTRV
jgi:hypothetical protein